MVNSSPVSNEPLFDEDVVFMFHSRSAESPPGHGAGERIPAGREPEFAALAAIPHWRRLLSNFDDAPFELDGLRWRSVEHCFQATKFLKVDPEYYRAFSLDSGSALSRALGAPVKSAGGRRARPLDGAARAAWERHKHGLAERAILAKFEANALHRSALLATLAAKLTHKPARSSHAIVELGLMRVRARLRAAGP